MLRLFYISVGGAVGALMRYWLSGVTQRIFNGGFPWGTLSVNLVGSLIIGFLWGMFEIEIDYTGLLMALIMLFTQRR